MAIYFKTDSPQQLLSSFKKAIADKDVVTWSCDSDGDFTHATEQWKRLAWLRPAIQTGYLVMNIIKPQNKTISTEVYAIYHGRFIESMLAHFDKEFSDARASSIPASGDLI
jgi:hypothetical protein